MKRIQFIIFILIVFASFNTLASSGPIKQDSIIECNGKYFGNHGNPVHWHQVEKKNDKWVSVSVETTIPACYIKPVNEKEKVTLVKCSDGDTAKFLINGVEKKVRFLAIDTPEIDKNEPFSNDAKEYTCNALKNAKEIYLEYDSSSDKEDKYGRTLAFVHVDGVLLEKSLIEKGYAKVAYIYGDYTYVDELREAETIAKNNKVGIWQDEILPDKENDELNEANNLEEDSILIQIIKAIIKFIKLIFDLLTN